MLQSSENTTPLLRKVPTVRWTWCKLLRDLRSAGHVTPVSLLLSVRDYFSFLKIQTANDWSSFPRKISTDLSEKVSTLSGKLILAQTLKWHAKDVPALLLFRPWALLPHPGGKICWNRSFPIGWRSLDMLYSMQVIHIHLTSDRCDPQRSQAF